MKQILINGECLEEMDKGYYDIGVERVNGTIKSKGEENEKQL